MSDAIICRKLKQRVELFWNSRRCLSASIIICVISPAHECIMMGFSCLSADCEISISSILFELSHSILDWVSLSWIFFFSGFLKK